MTIQAFLEHRITWLQMPDVRAERSFNCEYARTVKTQGSKKKLEPISLGGRVLQPFYQTKTAVYYTTEENIEKHKEAGDL